MKENFKTAAELRLDFSVVKSIIKLYESMCAINKPGALAVSKGYACLASMAQTGRIELMNVIELDRVIPGAFKTFGYVFNKQHSVSFQYLPLFFTHLLKDLQK